MKIAQETLDIYAPIANRLGMSKVKNELEELSFKYLEPKAYEALRAKVEAKRKTAEAVIDDLTRTIRAKLDEAQIPVMHLDGRIKRLYSIHLKLKRRRSISSASTTSSRCGSSPQSIKDCYAALGIIHQTWSPVPGRIKDFIAMPRPNGYQSLHTSVISENGFPVRGADPHRGDASPRRGRHRRALEIQGRACRRPSRRAVLPVDAPAARGAAGGARPAGVPAEPEDRPLPRRGLHLHAERRGAVAAARRDRRSTSRT